MTKATDADAKYQAHLPFLLSNRVEPSALKTPINEPNIPLQALLHFVLPAASRS